MNLDIALMTAARAHSGQRDKGGQLYLYHPMAVMKRVDQENENQKIVALLHDVVEDSSLTLDDLRTRGFSEEVVEAVDALTRRKGETYREFILRAKENKIARVVKIADLQENMDLSRLKDITERDMERMERYHKALQKLF